LADFDIYESDQFRKKIKKLGKQPAQIIYKKLSDYIVPLLKLEPRFGPNIKKLKGYSPETWRYRFGDYRIFFEILEEEKEVWLTSVDNRKDAYK